MTNLPFEATIRLQVHLPRNQLYVCRVNPKTSIGEVFDLVCKEKGLNPENYEVRRSDCSGEALRFSSCILDYPGLNEITIEKTSRYHVASRSVSTSDILRLQKQRGLILGLGPLSSTGASLSSKCDSPEIGRRHQKTYSIMSTLTDSSSTAGGQMRPRKKKAPAPPPLSATMSASRSSLNISNSQNLREVRSVSMISLNNQTNKKRRAPPPPKPIPKIEEEVPKVEEEAAKRIPSAKPPMLTEEEHVPKAGFVTEIVPAANAEMTHKPAHVAAKVPKSAPLADQAPNPAPNEKLITKPEMAPKPIAVKVPKPSPVVAEPMPKPAPRQVNEPAEDKPVVVKEAVKVIDSGSNDNTIGPNLQGELHMTQDEKAPSKPPRTFVVAKSPDNLNSSFNGDQLQEEETPLPEGERKSPQKSEPGPHPIHIQDDLEHTKLKKKKSKKKLKSEVVYAAVDKEKKLKRRQKESKNEPIYEDITPYQEKKADQETPTTKVPTNDDNASANQERDSSKSLNPLAKKPMKKLNPVANGEKESSKDKSPNDNLPYFKFALASTAHIPGHEFKGKTGQIQDKPVIDSDDGIEDEDLVEDLSLFNHTVPPKPKVRKSKASSQQKPQVSGLTLEEKKILEESMKLKEEEAEKQRQADLEKSAKAKQGQLVRKAEEEARLARTKELKILKDLKAKASKEVKNELTPTEQLRAQLKMMSGQSAIKTEGIKLDIDENDDLLPIRRKANGEVTQSDSSSEQSDLVEDEKGQDVEKIPASSASNLDAEHNIIEENNENSLNHSQAISDALDESYAAIDFGPELDVTDEEEDSLKENPLQASEIEKSHANLTNVNESVTPITLEFGRMEQPQASLLSDWSIRTIPEPPSGFKDSIVVAQADPPEKPGQIQFSINSYNERSYPTKVMISDEVDQKEKDEEKEIAPPVAKKSEPKIARAQTFSATSRVPLHSTRVMPNDDLTLNRARMQKSVTLPPQKKFSDVVLRKTSSSLETLDEELPSQVHRKPSILETLAAIRQEFAVQGNNDQVTKPEIVETKEDNPEDLRRSAEDENNIMMHHHPNSSRFYQYGPPSIVMGTWGDRKGRSQFAPPPAPFAIPPAGVPGGRLGPAPVSRINAGYHSLQYTSVPTLNQAEHQYAMGGQQRKLPSKKFSLDSSKETLQKKPQVKAFVSQVEVAKNQDKLAWSKDSTTKSPVSNGSKNATQEEQHQSKRVPSLSEDPKSIILAAAKNPSGLVSPSKPQFYFGQPMTELVKSAGTGQRRPSAIEKVKLNEALTHPKKATTTITPGLSEDKGSLSSGVSSLSSSSNNSSSRSSPAKDVQHSSPVTSKQAANTIPASLDFAAKAFESQLIAGRNRLKKASVQNEVGQPAKLPPAPVPPPPPPALAPAKSIPAAPALRSYEIPQAPKLKKVVQQEKKGLVPPNGISAREELMMAIRGTGGFKGLKKTNSGKNL